MTLTQMSGALAVLTGVIFTNQAVRAAPVTYDFTAVYGSGATYGIATGSFTIDKAAAPTYTASSNGVNAYWSVATSLSPMSSVVATPGSGTFQQVTGASYGSETFLEVNQGASKYVLDFGILPGLFSNVTTAVIPTGTFVSGTNLVGDIFDFTHGDGTTAVTTPLDSVTISPTPLPGAGLLFGTGLAIIAGLQAIRRRNAL